MYQVRHICKAHSADTQKPTLQKSLPCSHASGTHPASVDTDFQFKSPRRRANIQHGVCCYSGATNKASAICKHRQQFQRDEQHQAIVLNINIINFIQQRFGAGRSMNAATAASPVR
jgi:hypothetical protein